MATSGDFDALFAMRISAFFFVRSLLNVKTHIVTQAN
jgi:hypothetical protein